MKVIFTRSVFTTLSGKSLLWDSKAVEINEFQFRTVLSNIQREQRNYFVVCLSNQCPEIARIIFQGWFDREMCDGNWFSKTTS